MLWPWPASARLTACLAAVLLCAACVSTAGSGGGAGATTGGSRVGGPAPVFTSDAATGSGADSVSDSGGPFTTKADSGSDGTVEDTGDDVDLDAPSGSDSAAPVDSKSDADAKAEVVDAKTDASDAKTDATDAKEDAKPEVSEPVCGDGSCQDPEACTDCPQDCGPCAPSCGDAKCEDPETCETCPADCTCAPKCGDKTCDKATENCQTCPDDCGNCPAQCGNTVCEAGETCASCPKDCPCTPKCGDKLCDKATENCQSCPTDCGVCPGQCNVITNLGCPSGQHCYPQPGKPPICAAPGTIGLGKSCNALADCTIGLLCIGSVCGKVCDTSGATAGYTCTSPAICGELNYNGTPLGGNIGVCQGGATCNLVTNVGCATGLACITFGTGKACIKSGVGGPGAVCQSSEDCSTATVCVNDQTGKKTCAQKCNTATQSPKCGAGTACQALSMGTPPKTAPDSLGGCL